MVPGDGGLEGRLHLAGELGGFTERVSLPLSPSSFSPSLAEQRPTYSPRKARDDLPRAAAVQRQVGSESRYALQVGGSCEDVVCPGVEPPAGRARMK